MYYYVCLNVLEYNELKSELSDFLKGFAQQGRVCIYIYTCMFKSYYNMYIQYYYVI